MKSNGRGLQSALLCLSAASCVAVLAACGGPAQPAGPGEPTSAVPTASPSAESRLAVLHRDGDKASTWQLTCSPAGGTHPDPQSACQAIEKNDGAAFKPVDPDTMCTEVYGGPGTATITGTWRGQEVNSRLNLTNGCEIARWEALVGLLPPIDS